jgi:hypothetical protein
LSIKNSLSIFDPSLFCHDPQILKIPYHENTLRLKAHAANVFKAPAAKDESPKALKASSGSAWGLRVMALTARPGAFRLIQATRPVIQIWAKEWWNGKKLE